MSVMRVHHVQLSAPAGGEDAARRFWVEGFGLVEVPKPAELAGRGGCWFRAPHGGGEAAGGVEIHVGIEQDFTPARKAHPALLVDRDALDGLAARLSALGFEVNHAERETFEGHLRFHIADPHGNRVEVLAPLG